MTTWGEFRTKVRRSMMKDEAAGKYSDDVLLDSFTWAQRTFCDHTSLPLVATYTDSTGTEFDVPVDIYSDLETTGYIYFLDGDGEKQFYAPVRSWEPLADRTFSVWGDQITLSEEPDDTLNIRYYGYYPEPEVDEEGDADPDSELLIPLWSESALAALTAAHAMIKESTAAASIERFREALDKGNPSDNAIRQHSDWLIKQYDLMVSRHSRQHRENN